MKDLSLKNIIQFIKDSSTFKKYFLNTGWLFLEKFIRTILLFFIGIYIARYLGPKDFGLLSYAISFITLGIPLANLGLDSIIVKEFTQKRWGKEVILGTSFALKFISSIIVYSSLTIIYYFFLKDDSTITTMLVFVSIGSVLQSFNVIDFYLQSQVQAKYSAIALSSSIILSSIIKFYLVIAKFPLVYFAAAFFLEFFILSIMFLLIISIKKLPVHKWKFKFLTARNLLSESWPLIFSGIVITIYMKIDQIMLKEMLNSEALGNYSAAVKLSEFWYILPMIISTSLFPLMTKTFNKNYSLYLHRLKTMMSLHFWSFVSIGIIFYIFSQDIILLVFGNKYDTAHQALSIHIFAGCIVAVTVIFSQHYILTQKTKLPLIGNTFGAITNVLLNLYLIPRCGIQGAAIATLISYFVPTLLIGLFIDRKIGKIFLDSIFYIGRTYKP